MEFITALSDIFLFLIIMGVGIGIAMFIYFKGKYIVKIPPAHPNTIKVACVGDSVTFGAMVKKRKQNCYPTQLQLLLGDKYSVRNFGANSHTMQKKTDFPYITHAYYAQATAFDPDIVLLMLGSNDAKVHNFSTMENYIADYKEMIGHFFVLKSKPKIFLMTSASAYILKKKDCVNYDINNDTISLMAVAVTKLAKEYNFPLIDVNKLTKNHPEWFEFDGVHPDAAGAKCIAHEAYKVLMANL